MKYPSQEYLKECLDYNQHSGLFTWRKRPQSHFCDSRSCNSWNAKFPGKPAGTDKLDKGKVYKRVKIDKKSYYMHRLAWIYIFGSIEDGMTIDHINGNGTENKITNLRMVTLLDNAKNVRRANSNTSGVTGINWSKFHNKWCVRIGINGTRLHVGYFVDMEDAIKARKDAEIKYGYHKNHGSERPL